jgi:ATP-dependent helicase/nuclease subunit A
MAKKIEPNTPPDQAERNLITSELDKTMLVEAAAGTGKTTAMIGRMVALLAAGKCRTDTLAAVTFTRKSTAELRARFQIDLEKAARAAKGEGRARLDAAVATVERCFIGTIHSFCARLLRERPVEAGVDVGFQELDDLADARLRQQAWEEYIAGLLATDDPILAELEGVGIEVRGLGPAFCKFCDYPDVEEWPAEKVPLPDLAPAKKQLEQYIQHIRGLLDALPVDAGNDKLMPKYRLIARAAGYTDLGTAVGLMASLERFGEPGKTRVVQREWPGGRNQALVELARWDDFAEKVAQPLVRTWREHRYEPVLRTIAPARQQYDRLRRECGGLNYQDLLIKAAALLREKPQVRKYFRQRFTHLLVDEFQDTDPIQAEVMLLLTSQRETETHWRKCRPVDGSLFVVGDPRQSIYRFRRADIATYSQVRRIIERSGGQIVTLSANFRTVGPLVEWVNATFDQVFPAEATVHAPARRPMQVGRTEGSDGELAGLRVLQIPSDYRDKNAIAEYEAGLLARTIQAAIVEGRSIPRSQKELEGNAIPGATAGDFLIITRSKGRLSVYARKLQELGIPCQVTGGTSLNEVDELRLLSTFLFAVTRPDDPVALVATLRGRLFGISDTDLYAFKRAGGRFSFHATIPEGLKRSAAEEFQDAFGRLKKYALWLAKIPPVSAIEKIVADLGLTVLAGMAAGGTIRAGSLAKGIELLRTQQAGLWTAADLAEYLGQIVEQEEKHDGVPARPHEAPAVRIMNLHKVKGLEAPVVFLADPSGESDHDVDLHIDRSGDRVRGYLAVFGEARGWQSPPLLAHPQGWDALAAEETRFRDAENQRLLYVAATRAGTMLTITQRGKANNRNPWKFFAEHVGDSPPLEDPGEPVAEPVKPVTVTSRNVSDAVADGQRRWQRVLSPTYATAAAKAISLGDGRRGVTSGEHGTEWGTVIHLLLETAMRSPNVNLERLASSTIGDQGLSPDLAEAAIQTVRSVMESAIWQRAMASPQRLVEVPFQTLLAPGKPTKSSLPTLLRGVIDLVFREKRGWVIVDYKTDRAATGAVPGLAARYAPQLATYAKAWRDLTSQDVHETGLLFTHPGCYVVV